LWWGHGCIRAASPLVPHHSRSLSAQTPWQEQLLQPLSSDPNERKEKNYSNKIPPKDPEKGSWEGNITGKHCIIGSPKLA
jgi:hypothetical protein